MSRADDINTMLGLILDNTFKDTPFCFFLRDEDGQYRLVQHADFDLIFTSIVISIARIREQWELNGACCEKHEQLISELELVLSEPLADLRKQIYN